MLSPPWELLCQWQLSWNVLVLMCSPLNRSSFGRYTEVESETAVETQEQTTRQTQPEENRQRQRGQQRLISCDTERFKVLLVHAETLTSDRLSKWISSAGMWCCYFVVRLSAVGGGGIHLESSHHITWVDLLYTCYMLRILCADYNIFVH